MKVKFFLAVTVFIIFCAQSAFSADSMFDDDGNYSGQWKQMTNVQTGSQKYNSSNYSTGAWYINNNKQKVQNQKASYANTNSMNVVPFRYNTLDYTRVRKVKGGYGEYSARCSDIGDVSFCH